MLNIEQMLLLLSHRIKIGSNHCHVILGFERTLDCLLQMTCKMTRHCADTPKRQMTFLFLPNADNPQCSIALEWDSGGRMSRHYFWKVRNPIINAKHTLLQWIKLLNFINRGGKIASHNILRLRPRI